MSDDQLQQAQDLIIKLFQAVRPTLVEAYGDIEAEVKQDNTPVTALDKWVEQELKKGLRPFDTGIGFVGEEHGQEGNQETFWLIDPIDGTEAFVRGLPLPRNIVTLVDNGQPIMTVVYKFITDELYTARQGKGTFKNGSRLHCSDRPAKRCWVELSTPLADKANFPIVQAVRQRISGYRVMGDFPLVAEGKVDAMLVHRSGGGDWDYAPRGLMMQEAGAKVANLGSDVYDYRNHDFLAASPPVFDELMGVINSVL